MDARNLPKMLKTLMSRQSLACTVPRKLSTHLEERPEHFRRAKGGGWIHKLAAVDSSATVEIGAVIHENVQVGPHSHIGSGSIVGPHVIIGSHSRVWYNVALQNSCVGDHCIIHCGVCIGQDGFGFSVDDKGKMVKKPQMLQVKIGDDVEIGANCCIDRGSWRNTVIGDHTKIDNQVQIGHNVVIGHSCMICGQVGLGGSSTVGDYVVLGGKAGVADHVCVASKVRIAAKSGVTRDITKPGDYAGFPAVLVGFSYDQRILSCKGRDFLNTLYHFDNSRYQQQSGARSWFVFANLVRVHCFILE